MIHARRQPWAEVGGRQKVWQQHPWVAVRGTLGEGRVSASCPRAKEGQHGEQASLPPGKARMEGKGTRRRTDLRLSGLRENTRQTATRENGVAPDGAAWVNSPDVATCRRAICGAQCRFEAQDKQHCRKQAIAAVRRPLASRASGRLVQPALSRSPGCSSSTVRAIGGSSLPPAAPLPPGESDSALACAAGRVLDAVRRRGRDWPVWV